MPRTNRTYAPFLHGIPLFTPDGRLLFSTGNGYIYQLNASGHVLSVIDKGARALPGSESDTAWTRTHRLLLAYEESFSNPISPTSFTFGTEQAAVIQLAPNGAEQWRVPITGSFDPLQLLDIPRFKVNLKLGFGRKDHQGLSRPALGPDGTVYVRSIKGLHAINPPTPGSSDSK